MPGPSAQHPHRAYGGGGVVVGAEDRRRAQREGAQVRDAMTLPSGEGKVPATKEDHRQRSGTFIAARGVGLSEATYARANALVAAAEDPEDPGHEVAVSG